VTRVYAALTTSWAASQRWVLSHVMPPGVEIVTAEDSKWATGYLPQRDDDVYGVVVQYAEKQYYSILNYFDAVDKKVDEHLRFMTTLIGAVTALAASKVVGFEHPVLTVLGLSVVAVAVLAAMAARTPVTSSFPMTPRALLDVADQCSKPTKAQVESVIAASYQVTICGLRSIITWKSQMLRISTITFVAGFGLVLWSLMPY
jgi:hypothetical protein